MDEFRRPSTKIIWCPWPLGWIHLETGHPIILAPERYYIIYIIYCFLARAFWQNVIIFLTSKDQKNLWGHLEKSLVKECCIQLISWKSLNDWSTFSKCATKKSARKPLWLHVNPRESTRRFSFCSRLISCSQISTAPFSDNYILHSIK